MFEYLWLETKLADIYIAVDVPARDRMAAGIERFNERLATDPLTWASPASVDSVSRFLRSCKCISTSM